jgi:hypothetical protein
MKKSFLIVMVLLSTASVLADALWRDKLIASDPATGDSFAAAVSIDGDICLVGAPVDDDKGTDSGSAYIFRFDGSNWTTEAKLLASDGSAEDLFGISVSIAGDRCIIGAVGDDEQGDHTGSAYIFQFEDPNWVQQVKLLAFDGTQNDEFGGSVSLSGDLCLIGAAGDDNGSGSAYVFRFNGSDWDYENKLVASDGQAGDLFGTSVSLSGQTCAVGAEFDADNGDGSGSVYIFQLADSNSVQQTKLLPSDGAAEDFFGDSVCLDGDRCLIGAHGDDDKGDDSGSAYVFRFEDPNWVQQAKLTASDGDAWDSFGWSVSLSADLCLVGAYMDSDNGSESGSAYIFRFSGGNWAQNAKLLAFDGAEQDHFGWSVSIDGDNSVVGAIRQNDYTGAAYTFRPCPAADLTDDCFVDLADFAVVAREWLIGENLP